MRFANIAAVARHLLLAPLSLYFTLSGCGVNAIQTPYLAERIEVPPDRHIDGEYFIGLHRDAKFPHLGGPMTVVETALQQMYGTRPIVGCGGSTVYKFESDYLFCVKLPDPDRNIPALLRNSQIRFVEDHGYVTLTGVQVCPKSWGLESLDDKMLDKARMNGVFSYSETGKDVDVFVVDTGITFHKDYFKNNLIDGIYINAATGAWAVAETGLSPIEDSDGHGTAMAGLIAGRQTGVAKEATLHPIKVPFNLMKGKDYEAQEFDVYKALNELKNGRPMIMTTPAHTYCKGGKPTVILLPFTTDKTIGGALDGIVNDLNGCGFIVVTSAGNKGVNLDAMGNHYIPATSKSVITVGGLSRNGAIWSASNTGSFVDLFAPGEQITSTTLPNGNQPQFSNFDGTSASAAFAAGVVAQILSKEPGLTNVDVEKRLISYSLRDALGFQVLRSPFGDGVTNDKHETESEPLDSCNDTVSFASCPPFMSCQNYCNQVVPICQALNTSQQARGIKCRDGECVSCGLKDEQCCGASMCGKYLNCGPDVVGNLICQCGKKDQSCCNGTSCNEDKLACSTEKKCVRCGESGDPCCVGTKKCDLNILKPLVCAFDSKQMFDACQDCGRLKQPCCEGGDCRDGISVCGVSGTCESCGTLNLPCCDGGSCRDGISVCGVSGTCESCGHSGEGCCPSGPKCGDSLVCEDATNSCQPCGTEGSLCCSGPNQCVAPLSCMSGSCEQPMPPMNSCSVRCMNGEMRGYLGTAKDSAECIDLGNNFCESALCGTGNKRARVRFNGKIEGQDDKNCSGYHQACCDYEGKNGVCDRGLDCKPWRLTKGETTCSTGTRYRCE